MLRAWMSWLRRLTRPARLGPKGERAAAKFLKRRGYKIVASSRRSRFGEIDLVAVDGRTIVFVEVKTRTSDQAGRPSDAVDLRRQRRMTRAALAFLKGHGLLEHPARFDVIAVTWPSDQRTPLIEHLQNAFEPPDRGQMFS